tara:strand:+ start:995 stop:1465 length:471 start_codon:yes stop_codon:yes gene_type:complete
LRIFTPIFIIFITSCEQTELLPATAETLTDRIFSHKGERAVLVNVWALWCLPCVEEFPMIVNLQKKNNDLEVIFVSADFEDQSQDVLNFLNEHNVGPVSYIKNQKDEAFIQGLYPKWSGTLPFTIVYAKKSGLIIDSWEGKESEERFQRSISKALN